MGVSQKTIRAIGARGRPAVGSKLRVHPVQLGAEVRSLLAGALHVPAHERRREQEIDGDRDQPRHHLADEVPEDGRRHRRRAGEIGGRLLAAQRRSSRAYFGISRLPHDSTHKSRSSVWAWSSVTAV